MTCFRVVTPPDLLFEHDLVRKPVSTFRDHAADAVSGASGTRACRGAGRRGDADNFTRLLLTAIIYPGKKYSPIEREVVVNHAGLAHFTAFEGERRLVSGSLAEVALAVRKATDRKPPAAVLIFDDSTGRAIDLDLRGSDREILARLPQQNPGPAPADPPISEPRGRGRPRLGVVAREVTLLPRHWDWLSLQPGGASVALRKLVEQARRSSGDKDRHRAARDAAYHFMSAMAGNLPDFEEATRALFADDIRRFAALIAAWPQDIRDHAVTLAFGDRADTAPA
jgi:hypothetical protein